MAHPLMEALSAKAPVPESASYAEAPAQVVAQGALTEAEALALLHEVTGAPVLDVRDYPGDHEALALLNQDACNFWHCLPLKATADRLVLAMSDPWDLDALNFVEMKTGRTVDPVGVLEPARKAAADRLYASSDALGRAIQDILGDGGSAAPAASAASVKATPIEHEDAPVIKLVNYILEQGLSLGASDIHMEPHATGGTVRYRIDGTLHQMIDSPRDTFSAAVARVKVMSNLDVSETRFPQDGRITLTVKQRNVDFRVSTIPFADGEGVVLRILDKSGVTLDLDALGFPPDLHPVYERGYKAPHGMILVAGPTGSGKSTTLYATVKQVATPGVKVISVEDPVEFRLPGMMQSPIREDIGYTFEMGLRAILRHDPDIVMIGEMRDKTSAEIAVRAALTGHLVFSTIHTNDSVQAITRLVDMGIPDYLVRAVLRTVMSQRLVRKLCPDCRKSTTIPKAELEKLELDAPALATLPENVTVYEAVGCPNCKGLGYRGRIAIFEILDALTLFRNSGGTEKSIQDLTDLAMRLGLRTLRAAGLRRVLDGTTSVEEILKVTADY